VSSSTITTTFGAPADEGRCGQAGVDSAYVRPITPSKLSETGTETRLLS
jgi:hypothetical protein